MNSEKFVRETLKDADIIVGGSRPWDVEVHNKNLYDRVLANGTLGVGESYMDGWWDCLEIDELVRRVRMAGVDKRLHRNFYNMANVLRAKLINLQTESRAKKVARQHYDLGNNLYSKFLDPYMQYSCGYFKQTDNLNTAQEKKLDLICRKLQLKKGDRVLDLGCGWGGLSKWMATRYGCKVTGINISDEQVEYAKKITAGLPVEILNMDYRNVAGVYEKIVSVGMFEHVGHKNHRVMMEKVKELLSPNGLFLLHTIGRNESTTISVDPWIEKYIFPNSMIPSLQQITKASENLFVMDDLHNFGTYYDKTLMAWWKNFDKSWPLFKEEYGDRFYRMFRFYLLSSAGSFRARNILLWQIVFTHIENSRCYEGVR